jgi:thiamine-monophosphate kinase
MRTLADLGEFGLIERIARIAQIAQIPGSVASSQVKLGIGDDAAVIRPRAGEDVVVTTDALIEGVHFRWRSQAAATIGRRALAVNLSDLAAMGAKPLACTLALAAPGGLGLRTLDGLVRGLTRAAHEHGCPLVGGNLARATTTSLTLTVLGVVPAGRALRRSAARAGDRIFVTGSLGGAALALARADLSGGQLRSVPVPRLAAGRALARLRARGACIDVSDGLAADLGHVLQASGVGAEIDLAAVPVPSGFARACARLGLDPGRLAAGGGEDYELLFTLRESAPRATALARRLGVAVSEIGRITRKRRLRGLPAGGWSHF